MGDVLRYLKIQFPGGYESTDNHFPSNWRDVFKTGWSKEIETGTIKGTNDTMMEERFLFMAYQSLTDYIAGPPLESGQLSIDII